METAPLKPVDLTGVYFSDIKTGGSWETGHSLRTTEQISVDTFGERTELDTLRDHISQRTNCSIRRRGQRQPF